MRNRIPFLLVYAAIAVQPVALAQDASPSREGDRPIPRAGNYPQRDPEFRGAGGGRNRVEMTEKEWADAWTDAQGFFKDTFPNRWAVYETINARSTNRRLQAMMRNTITRRYIQLSRMQRENPSLYDAAIEQGKADDEVWAALRVMYEISNPNDQEAQDAVRAELRKRIKSVIEKSHETREKSLADLRKMLKNEEDRLAEDKERIGELVERRLEQLTSDNPFRGPDGMEAAPGEGPGGGPGGGQGPGPGNGPGRGGNPEGRPENRPDSPEGPRGPRNRPPSE
jgi:hypothetical protein